MVTAIRQFATHFERVPGLAEHPAYYHVGGFLPVHLGDRIGGHYRVLRKLGKGVFSTVWLARDESSSRYVALKIGASTGCRPKVEAAFLRTLADPSTSVDTVGRSHVQRLLDSFEHQSPNGTHQVLVLEPTGRTLQNYLTFAEGDDSMSFLRKAVKQLVEGLAFTHARGIIHRDLQHGNISFALPDRFIEYQSESTLTQNPETDTNDIYPLERTDGKPLDATSPVYVVEPRPLDAKIPSPSPPSDFRLVIGDFGAASSLADVNDGFHAFPVDLRPPELLVGDPLSGPEVDIWSLGCVIYRLITRGNLFSIDGFASREEQDDEHLQSITEVLGPLPPDFLSKWSNRSDFVDEHGNLLPKVIEEGISEPLEALIELHVPEELRGDELEKKEERKELLEFLSAMLKVNPAERMTAEDLLGCRWLSRG